MNQETQTKKCSKCQYVKSINEFHKKKSQKDGYNPRCKSCNIIDLQIYYFKKLTPYEQVEYLKNKNRIILPRKEYFKQYRKNNKNLLHLKYLEKREEILKYIKERYLKNPENLKEINRKSHQKHRKSRLEKQKIYATNHKIQRKIYLKNYYSNNLNAKIGHNLRRIVNKIIKRKTKSTKEYLGCTFEEFIKYIAKQFTKNMSWNNYGYGIDRWNIDHIIPISFFNFNDSTELLQCCHYTNLQPMWQNENFEKKNKTEGLKLLYNNPTPFH